MDWFTAGISLAQKHAQEAAEKAKQFAQQAAGQARVLAEQAKEAATTLAKVAAEEASGQLKSKPGAHKKGQISEQELVAFGVTEQLTDFIKSLTYVTFSDYPKEDLKAFWDKVLTSNTDAQMDFRLNPWQERHALVVLQTVPHLEDLRFVLCPRRMEEGEFWRIYFALAKDFLPNQAFTGELPVLATASQKQPQQQPKDVQMTTMTSTTTATSSEPAPAVRPATVPTPGADNRDTSPSRHPSESVVDNFAWSEVDGDADADLESYLKEALQGTDGAADGEASAGGSESDLGDLDEYLDQLNIEVEEAEKAQPSSSAPAEASSGSDSKAAAAPSASQTS